MSEPELTKNAVGIPVRPRNAGLLQRKLPYIAVLTLAVSGVPTQTFRTSLSLAIGSSWLWRQGFSAS